MSAMFKLKYVPRLWKVAEVIMVQKLGKLSHEITFYRPISLLPIMFKLWEIIAYWEKSLVPGHPFGFRNKHSVVDQIHRITDIVEKVLEEKKFCCTIFLDVKHLIVFGIRD